MIGCYVFGAFSIIFTLLFCWFRASKATVYSLVLKTTASICFILCGVFAIKTVGSTSINLLILVGLVMGLIGDIILDLKIMYPEQSNQYFIVGTTSFAIGHFIYFLGSALQLRSFANASSLEHSRIAWRGNHFDTRGHVVIQKDGYELWKDALHCHFL